MSCPSFGLARRQRHDYQATTLTMALQKLVGDWTETTSMHCVHYDVTTACFYLLVQIGTVKLASARFRSKVNSYLNYSAKKQLQWLPIYIFMMHSYCLHICVFKSLHFFKTTIFC